MDHNLQEVVANYCKEDIQGTIKILDYGNKMGQMKVEDSTSAAYGMLAMVIGLSFFRVAIFQSLNSEDNGYICDNYVNK